MLVLVLTSSYAPKKRLPTKCKIPWFVLVLTSALGAEKRLPMKCKIPSECYDYVHKGQIACIESKTLS